MRRSFVGVILGLGLTTPAAAEPQCEIDDAWFEPTVFASEVEAVAAMAANYRNVSATLDVEYVGAVYRTTGGSYRTATGSGCARVDSFRFRIPRLRDGVVVALWHTHGADGPSRHYFSAADAATVTRTGLPFYLATATGQIRVLLPEDADQRLHRLPGSTIRVRTGVFTGRVVARADG